MSNRLVSNARDLADLWNSRFLRLDVDLDTQYEPWLERHLSCLKHDQDEMVLDLGCGGGCDSRYLEHLGQTVVAMDLAQEGLKHTAMRAPDALAVHADLRQGLPFVEGAFWVVVANWSLHYLGHRATCSALSEVGRCLQPRGYLLARFNSVHDTNYGAPGPCGGVALEPGVCLVNNEVKRFFTRLDLETLFAEWRILSLEERVTGCYGRPKVVWELRAQRGQSPAQ